MILIVGATGNLGGAVTHLLLHQGKAVRILARPHSNYQPLQAAGAEVVMGDLKDPPSLEAACQGVDIVITTANSASRGGEDNVETVDLKGNQSLIEAASHAKVKQFIFVSVLGANPASPVPFIAAKGQTEKYLIASGVPYTIISPDMFMESWVVMLVGAPALEGRTVTLVANGEHVHSMISARDVAQFIVGAVSNPAAINSMLYLGGPEPVSFRKVVAAFERELGHAIPVNFVAPGSPIPGLPEAVWGMAAGFETFDSPVEMKETAQRYGVRLTGVQEFAGSMVHGR